LIEEENSMCRIYVDYCVRVKNSFKVRYGRSLVDADTCEQAEEIVRARLLKKNKPIDILCVGACKEYNIYEEVEV
jgi:hypothetical protein